MESVRAQELLAEQAAAFEASLAEKDAQLAEKDAQLAENHAQLAEKDAIIYEYERKKNQDPSFITPSRPSFNPWADPAPSSVHSSTSKLSKTLKRNRAKRCQITCINMEDALIAAHLWPRRHADQLPTIPGISHGIDSVRNGIFLAKPIEYAFDRLEACFLCTSLCSDLVFKVLRKVTNMHREIAPAGVQCPDFGTVLDWDNSPLNISGGRPSMKTLSAHATFALENARLKGWITKEECDEWMPMAQFHSPPEKSASGVSAWLRSSPGYTPGAARIECGTNARADVAASAEGFEASDTAANDPDARRRAARPGALGGEARSLHRAFAAVAETQPAAAAPHPWSAAGCTSKAAKSGEGRAPLTTAGGERSGSISAGPGSGAGSDGCSAAATAAPDGGAARNVDGGAKKVGARAETAATATATAPAAGAATDRPGTDEEIRRAASAREPATGPVRASARALRPGGGRVWAGLAAWKGGLSVAPPAESAVAAAAAKGGPRPQRLQAAAASSRGAAGGRLSAADSDGRAGGAGAGSGTGTARAAPTGRAYSARAGPDPVGRGDREVAVGPAGRGGAQDARPAAHWKGPALLVTRLLQAAGAGPRVPAGPPEGRAAGWFAGGPASAAPGEGARRTGGRV